jgi:hypothetical protein
VGDTAARNQTTAINDQSVNKGVTVEEVSTPNDGTATPSSSGAKPTTEQGVQGDVKEIDSSPESDTANDNAHLPVANGCDASTPSNTSSAIELAALESQLTDNGQIKSETDSTASDELAEAPTTSGPRSCKQCEQKALPGNYGFCATHRTPKTNSSQTLTDSCQAQRGSSGAGATGNEGPNSNTSSEPMPGTNAFDALDRGVAASANKPAKALRKYTGAWRVQRKHLDPEKILQSGNKEGGDGPFLCGCSTEGGGQCLATFDSREGLTAHSRFRPCVKLSPNPDAHHCLLCFKQFCTHAGRQMEHMASQHCLEVDKPPPDGSADEDRTTHVPEDGTLLHKPFGKLA